MSNIPKIQLPKLLNYVRSKISHMYEPTSVFGEEKDLRSSLQIPHKGLYLGFVDSSGKEFLRDGFMEPHRQNILDSADQVISVVFPQLRTKSYTSSYFKTSLVHVCVVMDVIYIANPMGWNENEDGLFFQWGQKYKGMYLPYQIKNLNTHKIGVLDRLCGWEARVASNLWRSPEGLVWKIICSSVSG